jgi:hypothetical protein
MRSSPTPGITRRARAMEFEIQAYLRVRCMPLLGRVLTPAYMVFA